VLLDEGAVKLYCLPQVGFLHYSCTSFHITCPLSALMHCLNTGWNGSLGICQLVTASGTRHPG